MCQPRLRWMWILRLPSARHTPPLRVSKVSSSIVLLHLGVMESQQEVFKYSELLINVRGRGVVLYINSLQSKTVDKNDI